MQKQCVKKLLYTSIRLLFLLKHFIQKHRYHSGVEDAVPDNVISGGPPYPMDLSMGVPKK